jgi:molecular chaperone HtpG
MTDRKVKTYKYKAEMKQLLHLIVHSLYTQPEIFIRELISNSSDALNKVRFLKLTHENIYQPEKELRVDIKLDKENNIFTITDMGIGMTEDDLRNRIGTVASSGTLEFLQSLKDNNQALNSGLIGHFGVGFYSVFMVTDEITIETRYAEPEAKSLRWKSKGEEKFTIEEIDEKDRGTSISFKLKEEYSRFADEFTLKEVLRKYSNFVDFDIYVNNEKVNVVKAIWHKRKDEIKEEELNEFYKFISGDIEVPLGHLHLNIEGNVNFKSLLFIPSIAPPSFMRELSEKTLQLYSNKVFISDEISDILPDYLRFLKGVVDTEDLPLNVSREVIQSSPLTAKIRQIITSRVIQLLEDWAKNGKDKYKKFFKEFGSLLKMGITSDFSMKDRLVDLYRFPSSHTGDNELTSFAEYVAKMKPEQKEIYFISGDNIETIKKNPNLEYFKSKDYEVIFLVDPVDLFVFPYIYEYDKKPIVSIEKADIINEKEKNEEENKETADNENTKKFIEKVKTILGDKVEDVKFSNRLIDSPVTLVTGENALDPQTEKMMQMIDKDFKGSKKIFEINSKHLLIQNLIQIFDKDADNELLENAIKQLFDGANLLYGKIESPVDFVSRMFGFMTKATK